MDLYQREAAPVDAAARMPFLEDGSVEHDASQSARHCIVDVLAEHELQLAVRLRG